MAQTDQGFSSINLNPAEFAATAKANMQKLAGAHSAFLEKLQEANKHWLDRVQEETQLVSELAGTLAKARSVPEAMVLYQDWVTRWLAMIAEESKQVLDDTQKFMESSAQLLPGAWTPKGSSNGNGRSEP